MTQTGSVPLYTHCTCCSQHISKGTTFTLKVNILSFQVALHFSVSLPLAKLLTSVCIFFANNLLATKAPSSSSLNRFRMHFPNAHFSLAHYGPTDLYVCMTEALVISLQQPLSCSLRNSYFSLVTGGSQMITNWSLGLCHWGLNSL